MGPKKFFVSAFLALAATVVMPQATLAQTKGETPPIFKSTDVLRGLPLSGKNYRIAPTAKNNGYVNVFTVTVDKKGYDVPSNALMRERVRELAALDAMEKLKQSKVFKESLTKGATRPLEVAGNMITSPVETSKGIVSGVGTFFNNVGHSMFGGASDQESGVLKTAIGFAEAKRKFAYKFGIDPYTSFPPVRERLDEVSWAATGGGLTVSVAFSAIGGTAGMAVKGTHTAGGMAKLIAENTPAELKKINARKLKAMKVNDSVAELFLEHPKFSPTQKTVLVEALAQTGASNRQVFIERAILVQHENEAYFMRRWAEAMRAYHQKVKRLARFVRVGKAPLGQRGDGVLVGVIPVDHLAWTEAIAQNHATNMKSIPNVPGVTGGEMWFEGSLSAKARAALEAQNWVVHENAAARLALN